jgi:hypothetical protein
MGFSDGEADRCKPHVGRLPSGPFRRILAEKFIGSERDKSAASPDLGISLRSLNPLKSELGGKKRRYLL